MAKEKEKARTCCSSEEKLGCERSGPWTAPSALTPSTNQHIESCLLVWRLSIKLKVKISVEVKPQLCQLLSLCISFVPSSYQVKGHVFMAFSAPEG